MSENSLQPFKNMSVNFLCSVLVKCKKEDRIKSPHIHYDCVHREKVAGVLLWVSACQIGLETLSDANVIWAQECGLGCAP